MNNQHSRRIASSIPLSHQNSSNTHQTHSISPINITNSQKTAFQSQNKSQYNNGSGKSGNTTVLIQNKQVTTSVTNKNHQPQKSVTSTSSSNIQTMQTSPKQNQNKMTQQVQMIQAKHQINAQQSKNLQKPPQPFSINNCAKPQKSQIIDQNKNNLKQTQQQSKVLIQKPQSDAVSPRSPIENDEFSFTAEHVDDEPSIHIRSMTEFQNIMKQPALKKADHQLPLNKKINDYQPKVNLINQNEKKLQEQQVKQMQPNMQNQILSNNVSRLMLSMSGIDETIQEPSCFFNEHNASISVLHQCQLIEMYCIPQKPPKSQQVQSKKQLECNEKLANLIQKVKQDVENSIILNQSKNQNRRQQDQNSRVYNSSRFYQGGDITDMTNESAFPNITNEELHITITKYQGNMLSGVNINGTLDDTNTNNNNSFIIPQTLQNNTNENSIIEITANQQQHFQTFSQPIQAQPSSQQIIQNQVKNQQLPIQQNTQTNNDHNNRSESNTQSHQQYVTKQSQPQGQTSDLHKLHLLQTLQSLQYMKQVARPPESEVLKKKVLLPNPRNPKTQKKVLIFDLDETLIHCVDDLESEIPDTILNVTFPNGDVVKAGVNVRPYAIECLKEANKQYQVVVFTASHKFYADVVLNFLDPTGELIHHRLYRDHCFQTEDGVYIKDLRIIRNRQLKDMVIVDNAVYSFGFQLDNGIPIIPFYNNKEDEELLHLINYISTLSYFNDLREQNAKAFQLKELENADITDYLEYFFGDKKNEQDDNTNQEDKQFSQEQEVEDDQAIQEEDNEEETTQRHCNMRNQIGPNGEQESEEINTTDLLINTQPLETSELDQDEIQKLKKKLEFRDLSSKTGTPLEEDRFTGRSTPAIISGEPRSDKQCAQSKGFNKENKNVVNKQGQMAKQENDQKRRKQSQENVRHHAARKNQKKQSDSELFHEMLVGESDE